MRLCDELAACKTLGILRVLISRSPKREDVPHNAIVSLAGDELEGALLSHVAAVRAPASRARRKLDATSRDEGAEPQDLFVR